MNKVIICLIIIFIGIPAFSAKAFNEAYYQKLWCRSCSGIMEYELKDGTRVDCLTQEYACEFDFAHKWYEGFTQALWYSYNTGKKPCLVLIMEKPSDFIYYKRAEALSQRYGVRLSYMNSPLLNARNITH